jgi:hypothetical protein
MHSMDELSNLAPHPHFQNTSQGMIKHFPYSLKSKRAFEVEKCPLSNRIETSTKHLTQGTSEFDFRIVIQTKI